MKDKKITKEAFNQIMQMMQNTKLRQEEARKQDPSMQAGIEKLKEFGDKVLQEDEILDFIRNETDRGVTLKVPALALLFKKLSDKINSNKNYYIVDDSNTVDDDKSLEAFSKLKNAIKEVVSREEECFIGYKAKSGHSSLFVTKVIEDKQYIFLIDSLGNTGDRYDELESSVILSLEQADTEKDLYFIAGEEVRQKNGIGCQIYVYKDLKTLEQNPRILDDIIDCYVGDLQPTVIKSDLNSNGRPVVNYFSKFPAIMMKMTQRVTDILSDARSEEEVKNGLSLRDYIKTEGEKYGVELFETIEKTVFQEYHNNRSKSFTNKYIDNVLPNMINEINVSELIGVLESYDLESM